MSSTTAVIDRPIRPVLPPPGDTQKDFDQNEFSSFDRSEEEQELMVMGRQDDDRIIQLLEQLVDRKDKTALPNWLMPIIIATYVALLGFVYTTMDRQIEKLERRIDTQETFTKNTREKLIESGWSFTEDGKIVKRK